MTLLLSVESNLNNINVYKDIEEYRSVYLKERIYQNKNRYVNKMIRPQIHKASKYMFLAQLFLITHESNSFHKTPSRYLEKLIANWNYETDGNEIIRKKFIKCVYGDYENLIIGDR